MKTIAITGASGFVGRHVIPELLSSGFSVSALLRSPASAIRVQTLGCETVLCDLSSVDSIASRLQGVDTVLHMAAKMDIYGSYEDFYADNVELTHRLLEASQKLE